jgi:hypothetical protein
MIMNAEFKKDICSCLIPWETKAKKRFTVIAKDLFLIFCVSLEVKLGNELSGSIQGGNFLNN